MKKDFSNKEYVLAINTVLQKKNDQNIQNFLNKYKNYVESPEFKENTGKYYDTIISHKSTIPDLVIYNKVFNKNECFTEANKNENNYFPRQCFYIKFDEKEKKISKGEISFEQNKKILEIKNEEKEGVEEKKKEEIESDNDDELEEEDDSELDDDNNNKNENVIIKNDNFNQINDSINIENKSIISNSNSFYQEIVNLPNNFNTDSNNLFSTADTAKPGIMINENPINYDDGNINMSYDSNIVNNINNILEGKNEDSYISMNNFQNNQFNNINNFQNFQISINNENNKIKNMFIQQTQLFNQIEKLDINNSNMFNNEKLNELKENIIKLVLFGPDGNIIFKINNFEGMFEFITNNIILKDKPLKDYDVYIIDTEEKFSGKDFYLSILHFLEKQNKIIIK